MVISEEVVFPSNMYLPQYEVQHNSGEQKTAELETQHLVSNFEVVYDFCCDNNTPEDFKWEI